MQRMEQLCQQLAGTLRNKNIKIAIAESCTGGYLCKQITDLPGASDFFQMGVVAYTHASRCHLLSVNQSTLDEYGAVSEMCAEEMVKGLMGLCDDIDLGISVTGIAGPGGGTLEKPVGTCWMAVSRRTSTNGLQFSTRTVKANFPPADRQAIRLATVEAALQLLLKETTNEWHC
eukprot:Selendium_serpulae@DN5578_c0_g1_i2.p2